jgi:hypothetical protein
VICWQLSSAITKFISPHRQQQVVLYGVIWCYMGGRKRKKDSKREYDLRVLATFVSDPQENYEDIRVPNDLKVCHTLAALKSPFWSYTTMLSLLLIPSLPTFMRGTEVLQRCYRGLIGVLERCYRGLICSYVVLFDVVAVVLLIISLPT